jgi:hypothetical protein
MVHETGNFGDNAAIVAIAASLIERGAIEDALPVLRDLRDGMEDPRSRRWLLPEVNRLIEAAEASRVQAGRAAPPPAELDLLAARLVRLEPTLIRIAVMASLLAIIVRIIIHEVLGALSGL